MAKTKVKPAKGDPNEGGRGQGRNLIKYTLGGFISYYKSANIRNKVKHPFYFSYHFHPLITLFYNRQLASSPVEVLRSLEKPNNYDVKKSLMVVLTPTEGESSKDSLEDLKKQFLNLFENNWKYNFIEINLRGSPICVAMLQEKASIEEKQGEEKSQKKWKEISKEELLEAYSEYYAELESRQQNEDIGKDSQDNESPQVQPVENSENVRRYEHFEIHQTIVIQSAFKNSEPMKKVKLEPREEDYLE